MGGDDDDGGGVCSCVKMCGFEWVRFEQWGIGRRYKELEVWIGYLVFAASSAPSSSCFVRNVTDEFQGSLV